MNKDIVFPTIEQINEAIAKFAKANPETVSSLTQLQLLNTGASIYRELIASLNK